MVDGAALGAKAVFDPSTGGDKHIVIDAATGTEFHHDFPDSPAFQPSLPDVAAKYAPLGARRSALGEKRLPVLFVRKDQPKSLDAPLLEALDRWLPGMQARLLVLDPHPCRWMASGSCTVRWISPRAFIGRKARHNGEAF